jgi:hypothetical protein
VNGIGLPSSLKVLRSVMIVGLFAFIRAAPLKIQAANRRKSKTQIGANNSCSSKRFAVTQSPYDRAEHWRSFADKTR